MLRRRSRQNGVLLLQVLSRLAPLLLPGLRLKCSGKNCPSGNKGKQARPNSLGNASTNCMD